MNKKIVLCAAFTLITQVLSNPAIIHDVDEPVDERQQVGPSVYSIDGISNKTQHNDVKEDQEDVQENFMVSTSEILQKIIKSIGINDSNAFMNVLQQMFQPISSVLSSLPATVKNKTQSTLERSMIFANKILQELKEHQIFKIAKEVFFVVKDIATYNEETST